MAIERLTEQQIEARLTVVEGLMARERGVNLLSLNRLYGKLIAELVARDMRGPSPETTALPVRGGRRLKPGGKR